MNTVGIDNKIYPYLVKINEIEDICTVESYQGHKIKELKIEMDKLIDKNNNLDKKLKDKVNQLNKVFQKIDHLEVKNEQLKGLIIEIIKENKTKEMNELITISYNEIIDTLLDGKTVKFDVEI